MRCFLLFVDGIGLGRRDPAANPFLQARLPHLRALLGGRPLLAESFPVTGPPVWGVAVDACLGVRGLPQSATGQTTILTGLNAPRHLGRHLNAHPTPRLRELLLRHSLFKQVLDMGRTATFLNAYRDEFFQWLELTGGDPGGADPKQVAALFGNMPGMPRIFKRYRPSASTVAVMAAGLPFRGLEELRAGTAVYHDITGASLAGGGRDYGVPAVAPAEAGAHAAAVAGAHDFVMYEHFLTDMAGHSQDAGQAVMVLETLDGFIGGLVGGLDPEEQLLILISDHGNLEDLTTRSHTVNPVPAVCWGRAAAAAAGRLRSLTDVTPVILSALRGELPAADQEE